MKPHESKQGQNKKKKEKQQNKSEKRGKIKGDKKPK
jgi:hypothetical protein